MILPYVAGVCERIRMACRNYKIRVVFRSDSTFRSLLTKVKDPLPTEKQANVMYEVPCTCGKVYIGKTKRYIETRLMKHKEACIRGQTDKLSIAEHTRMEDHPINWNDTKILHHASHMMKETLQVHPGHRDRGYELPDCWIALNKKI